MDEKLQNGKLEILRQSLFKDNSSSTEFKDYVSDIDSQEEKSIEEDDIVGSTDDVNSSDFDLQQSKDVQNTNVIEKWKATENNLKVDKSRKLLMKWIYDKNLAPSEVCLKDPHCFMSSAGDLEEADCSRFVSSVDWEEITSHSADLRRQFSNSQTGEEDADSSADEVIEDVDDSETEFASDDGTDEEREDEGSSQEIEDEASSEDDEDGSSVDSQGMCCVNYLLCDLLTFLRRTHEEEDSKENGVRCSI